MLGTVDRIDYDGDRVLKVVLHFPPARKDSHEEIVKEITTCERVGQGSFGTVYRALCEGYPNLALKIATGKATRLKQELAVLSKTCTQGKLLLPRFEFGALNKSNDLIVVGMELCVPRTLHDFLVSERLTSEADKLFLAHQAVQAVGFVHEAGCIHRDIKLQNFVFDLYGNVKLIDFGLACNSLMPPPGDVVAGTVSFMAPEMAHNALFKEKRVSVGAPGDVWSLGIVLFSIFTQRNPYPSPPAPGDEGDDDGGQEEGSVSEKSNGELQARSAMHSQASQSTRHRLANERLLKRVSAGEWRWPRGCGISPDLRDLVNSILVKDAAKRPTVAEILGRKMWNLRRRAPPAALERFLGVQDDFLLSRDEAHLMRAVEERTSKVNASLVTSRLHSVDSAGSDKENSGAPEGGRKDASGAVTPVRANGSLRVVTRDEFEVGGVPAVQIYDVRASTRKHSKPIREISQVIAEETAKRKGDGAGSATSRARSRKSSASAPASRANSRASSVGSQGSKRRPRKGLEKRAASTASSVGAESHNARGADENLFDAAIGKRARGGGDGNGNAGSGSAALASTQGPRFVREDVDVLKTATMLHSGPSSLSSGRPLFSSRGETDATATTAPLTAEKVVSTATVTTSKRARSVSLLGNEWGASEEEEGEDATDQSDEDDMARNKARRAAKAQPVGMKRRSRDPSLKMSSTAVLADLVTDNGFLSSVSRGGTSRAGSARSSRATSAVPPPPPAAPAARGRSTTPQEQLISHRRKAAAAAGRRTPTPPAQPAAAVNSLSSMGKEEGEALDVDAVAEADHSEMSEEEEVVVVDLTRVRVVATRLLREEAARRAVVAPMLLVEHEWLLASFRLTVEEDQERFNITWLAEEQAKSASHPHKFKELFQIPSRKYQYGFVCDFCDYEFLPAGKAKKQLHLFHCSCGRDLCPECMEAYRLKCTCSCCGVVHANSCVLRDHVRATGGRGGGRGSALSQQKGARGRAAAKGPTTRGRGGRRRGRVAEDVEEVGDAAIDEGPVNLSLSRGLARGRKAQRAESAPRSSGRGNRASMHMSIAAMHQSELGDGFVVEDIISSSAASKQPRRPSAGRIDTPVENLPEGPWRPFAKLRRDVGRGSVDVPTSEEREVILNGDWVRYFYLYPSDEHRPADALDEEGPFAFVYHIQPGRTGAVFLSSEFPMHSAIFSLMERQFFIVDQVNTLADDDVTRATTLIKAKSTQGLQTAYHAMQEIVSFDTNQLKQRRAPGTMSVYQSPRNAHGCRGEPYVFVRWFRFNEDRSLSAFLLSNGMVQVFVNSEFEIRWFDENRKFLVRHNGVCEIVGDSTFALAPAINQLLYGSFDA